MKLRVALTTTDLSSLEHKQVVVSSPLGLTVQIESEKRVKTIALSGAQQLKVSPKAGELDILITNNGGHFSASRVVVDMTKGNHSAFINSIKRARAKGQESAEYRGHELHITPQNGHLRIILILDMEQYLKGVLESEIPSSYHIEALKAQAVAARTYALNPRISHERDNADVCDSYLCCQYFAGHKAVGSAKHTQAIEATSGEILKYGTKAILALFSSN
ncbi:MAG TPA: SpoIID/LytB domain-containing protein, partial [Candidatus Melainabacteria bacterium]|nr:SpoIID/LytB domain-containing protein [Candidatus Melainabacteria bacterium]